MLVMDEILERYKQGKFQKCLELIKLLPPSDNFVDNIILQNSFLVVESVVKILKNNVENASEIEEKLYLFFDSTTSLNILDTNISLLLKLTATFNYFWWILFFNTYSNIQQSESYLDKIYVGLNRVSGERNKSSNFSYLTKSEKILSQLYELKSFIKTENHFTSLLIAEIAVVVLLIIFKFSKEMLINCTNTIKIFLLDVKTIINSTDFNDKHIKTCNTPLEILKFDLSKLTILLSAMDFSAFDYLQLLESVFLLLLGNFEESLKSLEKNQNSSSLWNYLKAFNFYKLNRPNQCLKYLKQISNLNIEPYLNMRIFILKGRLYCQNQNYEKSLKHFEKAFNLKTSSPLPYFYVGQQYGKMGLYELMTEWFEKLLKIVKDEKTKICHNYNIEILLLDCIHASDEINETEALYSLAISYGLNEKFNEASNIFERILLTHARSTDLLGRVIHIPNWLTVLHEASITNLLAGNLIRAENIADDAIRQYVPQDRSLIFKEKKSFVYKDVCWLQKKIEEELLSKKTTFKKLNSQFLCTEDFFFILPENIIALLIKAEIQKIQKVEYYKFTLKKIFSFLSNYIVLIVQKEKIDEVEKCICIVVKALTSKICLWLINAHISNNNLIYIEKMFKRALGCNKGDKDVFYNYCDFLLKNGKIREASKLWNSYYYEKSSVPLECIHSLSLRYFLATKISKKDMEKIKKKVQLSL